MSEYTPNYSLYLYKAGCLSLYDGHPRKKFATIREAIEYAQRRIAKLKSISKPAFYEFYRIQQILVVEYTDSWTSRIRGVLTDEGKCYTEIPLPINPEVLQTRMV